MGQGMEQLKPLLSTAKLLKQSPNPMGMLEMASATNPALKDIYNQTLAVSTNPKEAFYAEARSKGYSDEQINESLAQLQQIWNSI